jgi:CheY-like chemotaxis protein
MIFVVDDHRDTAELLCRLLRREGYEADCCHDGMEAIEKLKTITPQLIILDVQMPLMTGLGVLAVMRDDEGLRKIPVLVYSAGIEREQEVIAIQLGAKAYLVKGETCVKEIMDLIREHATAIPT